jgi:hypothetical protein
MMRDRQINAFATLGGYVAMNAGTVLAARNEDELAGVLAHEISHVTQRHVLRAVERAKKDQIPILLATLGVIVAAQAGSSHDNGNGGSSRDDAIQAAVIGGQALAMQRQLDYTRTSEAEADRVGLQTLYRSGYNVDGMADFFERMERLTRSSSSDSAPSYLQTHPVTITRMSEARERADRLRREPRTASSSYGPAGNNPLLPFAFTAAAPSAAAAPVRMFDWARERLRVLSADSPDKAMREATKQLADAGAGATDAQRYAVALAQSRNGFPAPRTTPSRRWPGRIPATCSSPSRWPKTPRWASTRTWRASASRSCLPATRRPHRVAQLCRSAQFDGRRRRGATCAIHPAPDPGRQRGGPAVPEVLRPRQRAGRRPHARRRSLCRGRLPQWPRRGCPEPVQRAAQAAGPELRPARPHRGAHREITPEVLDLQRRKIRPAGPAARLPAEDLHGFVTGFELVTVCVMKLLPTCTTPSQVTR